MDNTQDLQAQSQTQQQVQAQQQAQEQAQEQAQQKVQQQTGADTAAIATTTATEPTSSVPANAGSTTANGGPTTAKAGAAPANAGSASEIQKNDKSQKDNKLNEPQDVLSKFNLFSQNLRAADIDVRSRRKMERLERSIQQTYDSTSKYASKYLKHQYQNSQGMQKLIQAGIDLSEKFVLLSMDTGDANQKTEYSQGFSLARKALAKFKITKSDKALKEEEPKEYSNPVEAKDVKDTKDTKDASGTRDIRDDTHLPSTHTTLVLTPPLHKMLNSYQQLIVDLQMSKTQGEQELNILQSLLASYVKSPTLQHMMDTSLKFLEKSSETISSERTQALKKSLSFASQLCDKLKETANTLPKDPEIEAAQGPIKRELIALGSGKKGLEPTLKPA